METVPTKVQDFLDEDPALRGQNYVCLSFVSPEELLANKEVYFFQEFLKRFCSDMNKVTKDISERFPEIGSVMNNLKDSHPHIFDETQLQDEFRTFKSLESDRLEKAFHEMNEFRTTIRGVKVRGVFDTVADAKNRADFLKRTGDKFDIFIGQVGCWCPWSPNPHDIEDHEYAETQLNTFMKKYKENISQKDEIYNNRKAERMKVAEVAEVAEQLTKVDPWTESHSEEN